MHTGPEPETGVRIGISRLRGPLLLLTLGLACAPGCQRSQPAAPEAQRRESAELGWTDQLQAVHSGSARRIAVRSQRITGAMLHELADGCEALEVLELDDVAAAPGDLDVLSRLPRLRRLKLGGPVDDAGAARIADVHELVTLNLPGGRFTNAGLERLAGLPRLELLRFHSPNVTDDGLRHIAEMPSLRFLHLIDVPVSDAGIAHLHAMTGLESFYLDGGACTEAGLRALLAALPRLHFHYNQLHLPDDPNADEHIAPDADR